MSDMHERKAEMAREADAFIALPGNFLETYVVPRRTYSCMYFMVSAVCEF